MRFFILIFFLFSINFSKAQSGFAGGHLSYQSLGNDSFRILLTAFYECSSPYSYPSFDSTNSLFQSSCDTIIPKFSVIDLSPNDTSIEYKMEYLFNSKTCSNFSFRKWQFEYVGFFKPCTDWRIEVKPGIRTINVNLSSGSQLASLLLEFDNQNFRNNSGPTLLKSNVIEAGGNLIKWAPFLHDEECDSLDFAFHSGFKDNNIPNIYNFPYSPALPIIGVTIDNNTGLISFSPTSAGNFVTVVQVNEIIKGAIASKSYFELLIKLGNSNVSSLSDTFNIPVKKGVKNFNSDSSVIQLCEGDSFQIEFEFSSSSFQDSLILGSSFFETALMKDSVYYPNAPNDFNKIRYVLKGVAEYLNGNCSNLQVFFRDFANGQFEGKTFSFLLQITPKPHIAYSSQICQGDTSKINITNSLNLGWNTIYGDTINTNNFGCTSCNNTWGIQDSSFSFQLINQNSFCAFIDTLKIDIIQPRQLTINLPDTICEYEKFELDSIINFKGGNWNIPLVGNNFSASLLGVGNHQLYYSFYDSLCLWTDSVIKLIKIAPKPAINVVPLSSVCETLDSLELNFASPSSGTYFGNGVDKNFYPQVVGPGIFTLGYTHTNLQGCLDSVYTSIKVDTMVFTPNIIKVGSDSLKADISAKRFNWYLNSTLLIDTIQQILATPNFGFYEVQAKKGACISDFSFPYNFIFSGMDNFHKNRIHFYPNPLIETLNIESENPIEEIQVFDVYGKLVFQKTKPTNQIELGFLPKGIYLLKLKIATGEWVSQKVVKY